MKKLEKTLKKNKAEVTEFLQNFKTKLKIWGVFFRDERQKNSKTLAELEITPAQRNVFLQDLTEIDFVEARIDEFGVYGEIWIFGKIIKDKEIYIKITLGLPNTKTVCISFHISDFKTPMKHPFKTK